jgi:hypothetical protein
MRPPADRQKVPKELDELEEIARLATRNELENYERLPPEWEADLTLGIYFDGDERVFELYIAKERPAGGIVISTARVNRKTRSVSVIDSNLSLKK